MHAKLEDWKNDWYGVQLGLTMEEIDLLIERLRMLKADPEQHFHLSSTYQGTGGLGDITIYVQAPSEPDNMESISSKAFAPGDTISTPDASNEQGLGPVHR